MAVHLDLRRDLPKLQKALPEMLATVGSRCEYNAPCAVGAMVNPRKRVWLDSAPFDDTQIDTLIREGMVKVPDRQQARDLRRLQEHFDQRDPDGLAFCVKEMAAKYLATPATGGSVDG